MESADDEMATLYNLPGDPTPLASYKTWLKENSFFVNTEDIFRLYPAGTDAEVPAAFMTLGTDVAAAGAYSLAREMAHTGQNSYLYYFTYPSKGKMAGHGGIHGADLKFLSGVFLKELLGEMDEEDRSSTNLVWFFVQKAVHSTKFKGLCRIRTDYRAAQLRKSAFASPISATMMALSASDSIRPAIQKNQIILNADMFLVNRNEIGNSVSKLPCLRLGKCAFI